MVFTCVGRRPRLYQDVPLECLFLLRKTINHDSLKAVFMFGQDPQNMKIGRSSDSGYLTDRPPLAADQYFPPKVRSNLSFVGSLVVLLGCFKFF
jgi:hypothetical protein